MKAKIFIDKKCSSNFVIYKNTKNVKLRHEPYYFLGLHHKEYEIYKSNGYGSFDKTTTQIPKHFTILDKKEYPKEFNEIITEEHACMNIEKTIKYNKAYIVKLWINYAKNRWITRKDLKKIQKNDIIYFITTGYADNYTSINESLTIYKPKDFYRECIHWFTKDKGITGKLGATLFYGKELNNFTFETFTENGVEYLSINGPIIMVKDVEKLPNIFWG